MANSRAHAGFEFRRCAVGWLLAHYLRKVPVQVSELRCNHGCSRLFNGEFGEFLRFLFEHAAQTVFEFFYVWAHGVMAF